MDDFYRIKRLPPYVFSIVNDLKTKARAARRGRHRPRHGQPRHGRRPSTSWTSSSRPPRIPATTATRPRAASPGCGWPSRRGTATATTSSSTRTPRSSPPSGPRRAWPTWRSPCCSPATACWSRTRPIPIHSYSVVIADGDLRSVPLTPDGDFFARLQETAQAGVAEGQAAHPVLPAQPDHHVRGPRLLRAGGRVRPRAPADGRARLRLRRLRLRRLPAAVLPGGAGRQGRRRRDLLDLEVLQHGRAGGSASSAATPR